MIRSERRAAPTRLIPLALAVLLAAGPGGATARADGDRDIAADPSAWTDAAPASFRVRFECSNGAFVVEVTREMAPLGADRFYNLVRSGFFDDARFYRVKPGFIVQFGLSGRPEVDQAWYRARIRDDAVTGSNTLGTLSFATPGPNGRTTQLFINLGDNARLDGDGFAPFGRVVAGLDVVRSIEPRYAGQPKQDLIRSRGNAYLDERFPELDRILRAKIVGDGS